MKVPVRRRRRLLLAVVTGLAAVAVGVGPLGHQTPASALGSQTPHLVVVMLENKEYTTVVGSQYAPYLNQTLIPSGRLFTSYYASLHPSLPNYLMLTSGQFANCTTDSCPAGSATHPNLFAQLDAASPPISWKVYAEDMPSNCYKWNKGAYAVRHNPPVYYAGLSSCATSDVPFTQLGRDLSAGTLPRFAMLIPNIYDDMHSDRNQAPCSLGSAVANELCQGDNWLQANLPALLDDGGRHDVTVLVAFDEGTTGKGGGGRVMLLEIGPNTCAGCQETRPYTAAAIAMALDDWFGLPRLGPAVPSVG